MSTPDVETWDPSDDVLASMIRHLRGWAPGEYVSPGLLREWRAILRLEAERVGRARRTGRDPYLPRSRRGAGEVSARDVVVELLASPEGRLVVDLVLAMPALLAAVMAGAAALGVMTLRPDVRHEVAPTYAYMVSKVGGTAWGPYWGSRGVYVVGPDGRGRRLTCPNDMGCRAVHRAAVNGSTPARVRVWRDRLAMAAPADLDSVWAELDAAGAAAVVAADPLAIWTAEAGEPRGLLPDPPLPPVDESAAAGTGSASARPPYVPGHGGVS